MSSFDWERFLKQWSQEILESIDLDRESLPPEVIESGWFGYPGATESQIAQAEARLGISLPPSYRAFLKVTNGWRQTTPFIHHLWSVEEIAWFADRYPTWLNAWLEKSGSFEASESERQPFAIDDTAYFIYGNAQDCSKIRAEYLQTALAISERGEAAIYLLNPQIVTEEGEWEAWFLGDWLPGADRYQSFQAMMQAEYENFLDLREPPKRSARSSSKQPRNSPDTSQNKWQTLASFVIQFQVQQVERQPEQRTIVRHIETDTSKIVPGIDPQTVQHWIAEWLESINSPVALSEEHQASTPPEQSPGASEATINLEITKLRIIPETGPAMVVELTHPVFLAPIQHGQPFALEVTMNIVNSIATLLEQPLTCRTQCIAHDVSTRSEIELGDVMTQLSTDSIHSTDRVIRFSNLKLQQPGIYRLKVWVTPQDMAVSPGYFKVPMLQVL